MAKIDIIKGVNCIKLRVDGCKNSSLLQQLREQLLGRGYLVDAEVIDHANMVKVRLHDESHFPQLSSDVKQLGDYLYR